MTPRLPLVLLALLFPIQAFAAPPEWPDSYLTRVQIMALLETLNADLLSHPSATLTLERWCGVHHMAPEARLTARLMRGQDKPIAPQDRQRLAVADDETISYRRVQLFCGDKLLSEADNWYAPSRLTAEMNRQLNETDAPFGRVVKDLDFHRETHSAILLWSPLPDGWEMAPVPASEASGRRDTRQGMQQDAPTRPLQIPEHLLEHKAVLYTRAHAPIAVLSETYTRAVLDFPLRPAR
jgi:hypothetical protein